MRRGTIFILLFILIAVGIIAASRVLRSQPALEITVAVDPLAADWAEDRIKALNDTQPVVNTTRRVQFKVTVIDDVGVWQSGTSWKPSDHPDAWLAASNLSVSYAQGNGLPLVMLTDSLARTPLVWGGYVSRVAVLTENGAKAFDWPAIETAAKAESWAALGGQVDWRFIKLGFAQPSGKMAGVATLLSAAGAFGESASLGQNALNAQGFRDWLLPILASKPSFFTRGDPADAMTTGLSTIEIAMFPEVTWLTRLNELLANDGSRFRLNYPAYQFQLDFPLVAWQDSQTPVDERAAVEVLRGWLADPAQQASLTQYGLRPAASEPTPNDALFAAGLAYGIQLTPDYGQALTAPSRSEVSGLLQWVDGNQ